MPVRTAASSASKTFDWNAHQAAIPRLPLPALENTIDRYLEAIVPLCSHAEFATAKQNAHAFLQGDGAKLQRILEERNVAGEPMRALGTATSYVMPFWNKMYLGGRYPVPINSNPVILMNDLPDRVARGQTGVAAALAASMVRWFAGLQKQQIEPDFIDLKKTVPACMEEYDYLFGVTRIPAQDIDHFVNVDSKHIAVIRGADIFTVDVIDANGAVASEAAIKAAMDQISAGYATPEDGPKIGALGSQERNWWAEQLKELRANPTNAKSLDALDSALFVVALDHTNVGDDFTKAVEWGVHGHGTAHRWWDKNFTLLVDAGGVTGINFEHAPYDGATVLRLIEDAWHDAARVPCPYQRPLPSVPVVDTVSGNNGVTKLEFALSSSSATAVDEAHRKFASFAGITKFHALHFTDFGKAQIKKWRVSPDGYIQMAYQLAHKRLHGTSRISVYESCSTKRFLRGRTEAIRPTTLASTAFVDQVDMLLGRGTEGLIEARKLLDTAAGQHRTVATLASQGSGVDRHLFSLLSLAGELGFGADAAIWADAAWSKFNTTILSTSNVNGSAVRVLGFGAVCAEGYGIGYTVKDNDIKFAISNFVGNPDTGGSGFGGVKLKEKPFTADTNVDAFAAEIYRALTDMRTIAEMPQAPVSKL